MRTHRPGRGDRGAAARRTRRRTPPGQRPNRRRMDRLPHRPRTGLNRNTRTEYRRALRIAIEGSSIGDDRERSPNCNAPMWSVRSTRWKRAPHSSAGTVAESPRPAVSRPGSAPCADRKIGANPARGVKWTRTETKEQIALTPTEFRALLDLMPAHYRLFIEFLAETGCRFNEVTALRPSDVNRRRGHGACRRTMRKIRGGDGYEIGDVKTRRSRRTIQGAKSVAGQAGLQPRIPVHQHLRRPAEDHHVPHGVGATTCARPSRTAGCRPSQAADPRLCRPLRYADLKRKVLSARVIAAPGSA